MTVSELMARHGVERVVYVPASELLPQPEFHAWLFENTMDCGIGETVEDAIADAVQRVTRKAA